MIMIIVMIIKHETVKTATSDRTPQTSYVQELETNKIRVL